MSYKLGAQFITAALGPVNYAGRCLMERQVEAGLAELTRDSLMGSVDRGIETVARTVGVSAAKVAQHLPRSELDALMASIETRQREAVEQWRAHTGHAGGLLSGIADLSDDGQPPDASACLARLAERLHLDKELAQPLAALSRDVARWRELLQTCRHQLEGARELDNAHRRRLLLRAGALALAVGALVATGVWLARRELARHRIETALADGACGVEHVDQSDVARAGSALESSVDAARRACDAQRTRERQEAEAQRLAAEHARQAEEQRRKLSARCDKIAHNIDARVFEDGDAALVGKQVGLLRRIAAGELSAADVRDDFGELACAGTPGGKRIGAAFARLLVTSAPTWILAVAPSKRAQQILVEHKAAVSTEALALFDGHIEDVAKRAVVSGTDEVVGRAIVLCKLKGALDMTPRNDCSGALALEHP